MGHILQCRMGKKGLVFMKSIHFNFKFLPTCLCLFWYYKIVGMFFFDLCSSNTSRCAACIIEFHYWCGVISQQTRQYRKLHWNENVWKLLLWFLTLVTWTVKFYYIIYCIYNWYFCNSSWVAIVSCRCGQCWQLN